MLIAIPTKGRIDRQVTLKNFVGTPLMNDVVLCPPEDEKGQYEDFEFNAVDIEFVPKKYNGIARTREWIITELAAKRRSRFVFMVDDDMDFCHRPSMASPKLNTIHTGRALYSMFSLLEGWLHSGVVHVGISARQGNNHIDEKYVEATRMMNAFGYDTKALTKLPIKFGRVPVMEDFDLTLQILRLGYANRVTYQYCWNQRGSNARGGCSTYRTAKSQSEAAHKLQSLHPEYVKVVRRKSKVYWKDMEERDDVRIQWKKAHDDGVSKTSRGAA